jgi:hypothetical protein
MSICLREATSLAAFDTFGPMAIVPADHHSGDLNSRLEAIAARQVSKHQGDSMAPHPLIPLFAIGICPTTLARFNAQSPCRGH